MGKPATINLVASRGEYIAAGGERREVKHLSTSRNINQ